MGRAVCVTAGLAAQKTTSDDRGRRTGTTAARESGCLSRTSGGTSRGSPPSRPHRTCSAAAHAMHRSSGLLSKTAHFTGAGGFSCGEMTGPRCRSLNLSTRPVVVAAGRRRLFGGLLHGCRLVGILRRRSRHVSFFA